MNRARDWKAGSYEKNEGVSSAKLALLLSSSFQLAGEESQQQQQQQAVSSLFSVLMMAFENRSGMMVLRTQLDIAMGKSTFNAKKTAAWGHTQVVKLGFSQSAT